MVGIAVVLACGLGFLLGQLDSVGSIVDRHNKFPFRIISFEFSLEEVLCPSLFVTLLYQRKQEGESL